MKHISPEWFLVKMDFCVLLGQSGSCAQLHTQWRLLLAADTEMALSKADEIGRTEGQTTIPVLQGLIKWQYLGASEILPLRPLQDGAEIYAHYTPFSHT